MIYEAPPRPKGRRRRHEPSGMMAKPVLTMKETRDGIGSQLDAWPAPPRASDAGPSSGGRRNGGDPCHHLPGDGMGSDAAYDFITAELLLDGAARLNLATFVTTWMPPIAGRLMAETADKNMIDKDEYPQTAEIEARCVRIIAKLWNSPESEDATGCSTTGSSEAVMLGGMALKWRWRERMRAAGKPTDKPNLIMGANVQVCWEKFCRYWDVEPRMVPMEGERYHLGAERGRGALRREHDRRRGDPRLDLRRSYEPVQEIAPRWTGSQRETGSTFRFTSMPRRAALSRPSSSQIWCGTSACRACSRSTPRDTSTGSCTPGVGWAIWRDKEALPEDLVFNVNYLGGNMPTFALNFSRPGSEVIAQYFMFASLGKTDTGG